MNMQKEEVKNLGKIAEQNYRAMQNQERLAAVTDQWNKILMRAGEQFLPIIDRLLKITALFLGKNGSIIASTLKWTALLTGVYTAYKVISITVKSLWSMIDSLWISLIGKFKFLGNINSYISKIISKIPNISTAFSKVFSFVGSKLLFLAGRISLIFTAFQVGWFFGKLLNKIEAVSFAAQWWMTKMIEMWYSMSNVALTVWNNIKLSAGEFWSYIKYGLGESGKYILDGIKSVGSTILNVLKQPFVEIWDFLDSTFFGHSPSKLGLLIVEGLKAVGSMIFDSITTPFKKAWDYISGLFSKSSIQPSIATPLVNQKMATIGIPVDKTVDSKDIQTYKELNEGVPKTKLVSEPTQNNTQQTSDGVNKLISLLQLIHDDLVGGKVAVNLDGQLISTTLSRNTRFRGNFGAIQG
jgi:hypothetical protein